MKTDQILILGFIFGILAIFSFISGLSGAFGEGASDLLSLGLPVVMIGLFLILLIGRHLK